MSSRRDVFFVNNINFQLLMALLVVQMKGLRRENTLLFINSKTGDERSLEALEKYFTLGENGNEEYENAYFFTTVYPVREDFYKLNCRKKILVYEGLTTYYTEYWASLFDNWSVTDFDEVLVPSTELVENPKAAEYVRLDCIAWLSAPEHLREFTEAANEIFQYSPELDAIERKHDTVLFDRHFEHFIPRIFKHVSHRLTTIYCAAAFGDKVLVKLHPGEKQDYRFSPFHFDTIKNRIPNELIYANLLNKDGKNSDRAKTYIIYNSSAAVNCYSLFGANNFEVICIGDLLNTYGTDVESSLASFDHTKEVLLKLNKLTGIRVRFPKNIEDVFRIAHAKTC